MNIIGKRYNDYSSFIKLHFGERVQKISLDIGFLAPIEMDQKVLEVVPIAIMIRLIPITANLKKVFNNN